MDRISYPTAVILLLVLAACDRHSAPSPTAPAPTLPTFALAGTVRDDGNDNLLSHVTVQLLSNGASSVVETAFEGAFSFGGVRGNSTLRVSASGYANQTRLVDVTGNTSVDFRLQRVAGRSVRCGDAPDTGNRVLSLFARPFVGAFPLTNYFDHDRPLEFQDANGYQLTACGERVSAAGRVDGHSGYDWPMPTGTPLQAVADGQVIAAGADPPFFCPTLGRNVSGQLFVEIKHPMVSDEEFSSVFVHLSAIDVTLGQTVSQGQQVGLSGNTGCSTEPHLHFQVWRFTHTNNGRSVLVDPYGWEGTGRDPWALDPSGAASIWLWKPGEAPALNLR